MPSLPAAVFHIGPVDVEPVGLPERAFIPIKAEPLHPLDDRLDIFIRGSGPVRVFDPEDERAARVPRIEPVEERCPRSSNMQMPGGARSKPNSDLFCQDNLRFDLTGTRIRGVRIHAKRIKPSPSTT